MFWDWVSLQLWTWVSSQAPSWRRKMRKTWFTPKELDCNPPYLTISHTSAVFLFLSAILLLHLAPHRWRQHVKPHSRKTKAKRRPPAPLALAYHSPLRFPAPSLNSDIPPAFSHVFPHHGCKPAGVASRWIPCAPLRSSEPNRVPPKGMENNTLKKVKLAIKCERLPYKRIYIYIIYSI